MIIKEAGIKIGDRAFSQRYIELARVIKEVELALAKAKEKDDQKLINNLEKKLTQLQDLYDNANIDHVDTEEEENTSSKEDSGKEQQGDEESQNSKQTDKSSDETSEKQTKEQPTNNTANTDSNQKDNSDTSDSNSSKNTTSNKPTSTEDDIGVSSDDVSNQSKQGSSQSTTSSSNQSKNSSKDINKQNNNDDNSIKDPGGDGGSGDKDNQDNDSDNNSNNEKESESNNSNNNAKDSSSKKTDSYKDPFQDDDTFQNLPGSNGNNNQSTPRDATLDDIIKQLKELKGDAKNGAVDGLKDLLNNFPKTESLTEAAKGLRELSDVEFNDIINDALDLVDKVRNISYINNIDKKKSEVKRWTNNTVEKNELQQELQVDLQKDYQQKQARQREIDKYTNWPPLSKFEINFYNAIRTQVDDQVLPYKTYMAINQQYEGEDILRKGITYKTQEDRDAIPVIDVYFDCSASFDEDDIEKGKRAIASIKQFEDAGEIKVNLFYFANHVYNEFAPARNESGTRAWKDILSNIVSTKATNVVIITDSDMDDSAKFFNQTVKVDGCVW